MRLRSTLATCALIGLCATMAMAALVPDTNIDRDPLAVPDSRKAKDLQHMRTLKHMKLLESMLSRRGSYMDDPEALEAGNDDEVPIMIAREGYPVEIHTVRTDDGYFLDMHRIPFGKNSPPVEGVVRPPVYLQHGLLCSSADWVMGTASKYLGYILADEGYDVWLGNYRGNHYGRHHEVLNPDLNDGDFWRFSWDHNGKYDIPAMIDHIISETGVDKIHYVGHSMGTTGFMVMSNERPDYRDKVIMANLLAPVAYVENMASPIRLLVPFLDAIELIADNLGWGEFLPGSLIMDILADLVCDGWTEIACESIIFLLCGFDADQTNDTLMPTIVHHTPAGTSTFTVLQYGQEVATGGFHHYDYGSHNSDHYTEVGPHGPPEYHITNVTTPVTLYWSDNDWLAVPEDVDRLRVQLPNIFDDFRVNYPQWNHLDYLYGIDADTLLYPRVIENMADAQLDYEAGRPVIKG